VSSPSRPHSFPVPANGEAALTAAVGIPDDILGQSIVVYATAKPAVHIITSDASPTLARQAQAVGAAILTKPFDECDLITCIKTIA
jgi:hypothetical protein